MTQLEIDQAYAIKAIAREIGTRNALLEEQNAILSDLVGAVAALALQKTSGIDRDSPEEGALFDLALKYLTKETKDK